MPDFLVRRPVVDELDGPARDRKERMMENVEKKAEVREPVIVRAARFVLEHGCSHVDNFTGCIVHDKKVERACAAQGRPTVYDMSELDEVDGERWDEVPLVIKRKKGGPKINPILLDATTASMIVQVYEKLSPENRARFPKIVERFTVCGFVDRLWRICR